MKRELERKMVRKNYGKTKEKGRKLERRRIRQRRDFRKKKKTFKNEIGKWSDK